MSKKSKKKQRGEMQLAERGYREVSGIGGTNGDWAVSSQSEDSDVWANSYLLTARMRDLARTNPTFQKYRDLLWSNIFGAQGIMLSTQVLETEDRVVYAPDDATPAKKQRIREELYALIEHERKINRLREWAAAKDGRTPEVYRAFKLADALEKVGERSIETVMRGMATVSVGAPDVYANLRIQAAWKEWQRAEFCDSRGARSYNVIRQLRLWSAVRDGGFFIRMVSDKRANKFGFTLQLINDEWCDRFLNTTLANGNVVRMGIEYAFTPWGIGKVVAYYFIKRQPMDWQFSIPGAFNPVPGDLHQRIDASEIIHYIRCVDADGTRPAPWAASVIPKARQLDMYELAEVVAAREQATRIGFFWSDVVPTGGDFLPPDPRTGIRMDKMEPGEKRGLPWGVKYDEHTPTHPNGNAENFRKMMLRSQSAGMPGADYSRLANDYEAINFSAGRLQMLDTTGIYEIIQANDIDTAEMPINERWLENALIFGAIPLPFSKLAKYQGKQVFQGERWPGVDEIKEATASALRVANHQSTNGIECARRGLIFVDVLTTQAQEKMMAEELGIDLTKTVQSGAPPVVPTEDEEDAANAPAADPEDEKPAPKKTNGKKSKLAKGARFAIAE